LLPGFRLPMIGENSLLSQALKPASEQPGGVPAGRGDSLASAMWRFLSSSGLLPEDSLSRIEAVRRTSGEPVEVIATRLGLVSEQALQDALSAATGLATAPALDRALAGDPPMPIAFLRDIRALPLHPPIRR